MRPQGSSLRVSSVSSGQFVPRCDGERERASSHRSFARISPAGGSDPDEAESQQEQPLGGRVPCGRVLPEPLPGRPAPAYRLRKAKTDPRVAPAAAAEPVRPPPRDARAATRAMAMVITWPRRI